MLYDHNVWGMQRRTYVGHEVKLESHGNDIESDDACDAQVKVLAGDDCVQQ